jgi:hypothetical protein
VGEMQAKLLAFFSISLYPAKWAIFDPVSRELVKLGSGTSRRPLAPWGVPCVAYESVLLWAQSVKIVVALGFAETLRWWCGDFLPVNGQQFRSTRISRGLRDD